MFPYALCRGDAATRRLLHHAQPNGDWSNPMRISSKPPELTDEQLVLTVLQRYRDLPLPEVARAAGLAPERALNAVKQLVDRGAATLVDRGKGSLNLSLGGSST
jgi:hypothetical protein